MAFDANDLSPHEHFVVERTRAGDIADFTPMAGAGGTKPAVRAGFLRKLMLGLDESWAVRTPGVRIEGARIEGALDLIDCAGAAGGLPALALNACDIPETVDLSHARLARLSLRGSKLMRLVAVEAEIGGELDVCDVAPITGQAGGDGRETLTANLRGLRVDGDVLARGAKFARAVESDDDGLTLENAEIAGNLVIDGAFEAFGCVRLSNARIDGALSGEGAQLLNRSDSASGQALNADGAEIGAVILRSRFRAEGEVRFASAHILRDMDLSAAQFRNDLGAALVLSSIEVGGELHAGAIKTSGQVMLQNARIGRNLDLRGAEITHRTAANTYGRAIEAPSVGVGGAALLQGANVKGEVFLADARIDGYLAFGGGRFINPGAWAIRAPNARVGGNLSIKIDENGYAPHGQKTVIEGGAKFDRAKIDGAFTWLNLELRGAGPDGRKGAMLTLADAKIDGPLQARALAMQQDARIDLSGASCTALDDDLKSGWGVDGAALDLDGLAYERIENANERWRDRLHWLKRSRGEGGRFSPQPFGRAAEVYARSGRRDEARRILLAQQDLQTRHGAAGPLTWVLSSLFGLAAGYGLAPIRIVRALVLFIALGVAGVLTMNAQGALVRPDGTPCNGAVEPALYAIDVALPVIDLGQESRCAPGRAAHAQLSAGIETPNSDWRLFEGAAVWKWAQAIYAILGAILSALAVITFSGVLKPRAD
ncbi:MAG: hypothetical protein JSS00_11710 [Proteobacteria bacterium]|nr:hypothetical protein [Pseudomonadota bacterium]